MFLVLRFKVYISYSSFSNTPKSAHYLENFTMSEVQLRVGDARQRDVGRGIARIDQRTMQKLGISAGDVIEIVNKRTTSAIAWPAYSEDQNRDIIRIDGFTRKNSAV